MIKPFAVLLLTFALLTTLTQPSAARSFVYVTNYGDGTVSQFRANPNGTLTPLHPAMVRAHLRCRSLAVARGRFLYTVSAQEFSRRNCLISQFRIRPNGTLAPLSPPQVLVPGTPASVAVEPSGRFAYVFVRYGSVIQYRIGLDGQLSPLLPMSVMAADAGGIVPIVAFDKRHHVLYGSYAVGFLDTVLSGTFAFTVERNGQLMRLLHGGTFQNADPQGTAAESISLTPEGRYAYVSEEVHDMRVASQWRSTVAQYQTRANGGLTPLSQAAVEAKGSGTTFIGPKGHFLYLAYMNGPEAGGTAPSVLAHARIHKNGTLGKFQSQPLNFQAGVEGSVFPVAFSPTGKFCYFVDGDVVYLFRVRANGSLSPLHRAWIAAGHGPLGVAYVRR